MPVLNLEDKQIQIFRRSWFVYGNGGVKSTLFNHKLIQGFVGHGDDRRKAYRESMGNITDRFGPDKGVKMEVTEECLKFCDLVMDKEYEQATDLMKINLIELMQKRKHRYSWKIPIK